MNNAILHYHLNRGGVTQVIVNHLRALSKVVGDYQPLRVAIIHGGRQENWPADLPSQIPGVELSLHVVPEIDYDTDVSSDPHPTRLAKGLAAAMGQSGFASEDTVLHVHNHSLGKNVALPEALGQLARDGYALLLHIHDFVEDFRPGDYRRLFQAVGGDPERLCAALYPQAAQVHYAVLNGRDLGILRSAGVPAKRLHSLPNPVAEFDQLPTQRQAREKVKEHFAAIAEGPYIIYPVRGIRRKNLGEALLWSALADGETHIGLTMPPLNPAEQPSYRSWKKLAAELSLPVVFETASVADLTFGDNLAAADAILTTSVAEGFGMVFLEAWLAGRRLLGRNLPEITGDYARAGVNLDSLYERLAIPLEWTNGNAFFRSIQGSYRKVLDDFGQPQPTEETLGDEIDALVQDGTVDFACLATSLQTEVVRSVAANGRRREALLELNPQIATSLATIGTDPRGLVANNAEAVRENYSLRAAGRRLHAIYSTVCASRREDRLAPPRHGHRVLASFLDVTRLQPLRTET